MQVGFFEQSIMLLGGAVVATAIFRRMHLPPILAYLFVGVILGPYALGMIENNATIHLLSELGVVFLLFMLGLEFSLPRMLAMRTIVLGLGSAQVIITSAVVLGATYMLGMSLSGSVVIAGALALSSTAMVTRELIAHNSLELPLGRIAIGVLLFQDIAAVFFLILIPSLQDTQEPASTQDILFMFGQGIALLVGMMFIGRKFLPKFFHEVAHSKSAELFVLTSLVVALSAAWLTHAAGLSMALGGFLAGMMLGESHYKHQLESDIRPFRDLLLGLFFVSVGPQLDLITLMDNWYLVLLFSAALMVVKTLIVYLCASFFSIKKPDALRAGMCLSQGGEFGFALLALAFSYQIFTVEENALVIATIIVTMVATPFVINQSERLANKLFPDTAPSGLNLPNAEEADHSHFKNHVIVCGYGRVGQIIARFLAPLKVPYVIIDSDPIRVHEAVQAGEPIYYGDCRNISLIGQLGADNARLLLLTFPNYSDTLDAARKLRDKYDSLPILVRTSDDSGLEQLQAVGVTEVIPEALEGSLMLVSHVLAVLGIPQNEIDQRINQVRSERYQLLHAYYHGDQSSLTDDKGERREFLHSVTLDAKSYSIDHTIEELNLGRKGVEVSSVRRGSESFTDVAQLSLSAGDVVVLRGTQDKIDAAEAYLLGGKKYA